MALALLQFVGSESTSTEPPTDDAATTFFLSSLLLRPDELVFLLLPPLLTPPAVRTFMIKKSTTTIGCTWNWRDEEGGKRRKKAEPLQPRIFHHTKSKSNKKSTIHTTRPSPKTESLPPHRYCLPPAACSNNIIVLRRQSSVVDTYWSSLVAQESSALPRISISIKLIINYYNGEYSRSTPNASPRH